MPTSPRDLMGGNASYKRTALFSNLRADVGIGPYAVGKPLHLGRACPWLSGVPSTPVPGCARSTLGKHRGQGVTLSEHSKNPGLFPLIRQGLWPCHLPRRGRLPPAGAFPYLPLGEGAAAAAEEGRYQVGSACRPTPVRASPCHPLPGEGYNPLPSPAWRGF